MERSITVRIKNVYGNEMIYPVSEGAKLFASLIGTKTLSMDAITKIKQLGYSIIVEQVTL